jgi:hypothetical protein
MKSVKSANKQSKPWLFQPGQSGNPAGRPKGSLSVIGRLKQIYQDNPEKFEAFVLRYAENQENDKHQVEMIDGKPKQALTGDPENPIVVNIIKYQDDKVD